LRFRTRMIARSDLCYRAFGRVLSRILARFRMHFSRFRRLVSCLRTCKFTLFGVYYRSFGRVLSRYRTCICALSDGNHCAFGRVLSRVEKLNFGISEAWYRVSRRVSLRVRTYIIALSDTSIFEPSSCFIARSDVSDRYCYAFGRV